jgi:large subunit ribosomal protein L10
LVTKLNKEEQVKDLKNDFENATAVFTTDQLGLTVSQITELRNQIREFKAKYRIAKNTLFKKAAEGTDYEELVGSLTGPSAVLFCFDKLDVEPAAKIKNFAKDNDEKVEFKGGMLDGDLLAAEQAKAVAGLPSKDTLLSQIAGMLVQVPSGMAYIFDELSKKDEDQTKLVSEFALAKEEA